MSQEESPIDLEECRRNLRAREQQRREENEARRLAARAAILAAIQKVLPTYPIIRRVYLFGSVTRPEQFHASSDIDVAVEGTGAEEYFAFWRDLERAAPEWMVDVREINEPSYFTKTVKERGELIYERQEPGSHL